MSRYFYTAAAFVLMLLLTASHWKAYHLGRELKQAEFNQAVANAIERAREREQALLAANEKVRADYAKQKTANAALVRANADRLREFQVASNSAAGADTAAASGIDDPYRLIANQCAAALVVLDEHAQGLRATARALQEFSANVRLKD